MTRTQSRINFLAEIAFVGLLFAVVFFGLTAWAQAAEVLTPAPLEIDPASTALLMLDGIKNGQWWIVAGGVVSLLTWGVRSGILKRLPGVVGVWFNTHPLVGYAIPFVLSAIGGVTTTFASGMAFTWGSLVGEILKVGVASVAIFIGKKKIEESLEAGKKAAEPIATKADAVVFFGKGPQP